MKTKKIKLVYPKLCYKIVGILYEVHNELGIGLKEKHYQKAVSQSLKKEGYNFKEQLMVPIKFKGVVIGRFFLDFLIENKVVLEIKRKHYFSGKNIEQVYSYLKSTGLKLGIIANFTRHGVKFKRIVNVK